MSFNQFSTIGWRMFKQWILLITVFISCSALAQADIRSCSESQSVPVDFTGGTEPDTLTVSVSGTPCSEAAFLLRVTKADGEEVYRYTGSFIEHMPYMIYEPELNQLVALFVQRVVQDAIVRNTNDLPPYKGVYSYYESTNDFVLIDTSEYEHLRQERKPILWHATGDSSWVHVVYEPSEHEAKVVMRGGVFH